MQFRKASGTRSRVSVQSYQRSSIGSLPKLFVGLVIALVAACRESTEADRAVGASAVPLTVEVASSSVVIGFWSGRLRETVEVDKFRITQHPVTRSEYGECLAAGACVEDGVVGCDLSSGGALGELRVDDADSPATCVSVAQARAYCGWVGGRLPRLSEWLHAARGAQPRRFSWSKAEESCELHPRLETLVPPTEGEEGELVRATSCAALHDGGLLQVGKHSAGASEVGMEDVLMTPAELIASEGKSVFGACDSLFAGCVVTGSSPGAIDSVSPIRAVAVAKADSNAESQSTSRIQEPYSFRCVLEGS